MTEKNWVFAVTPENWETIRSAGVFATQLERTTQRIEEGDRLVIYIVGSYSFRGALEVVGPWYRAQGLTFPDEIRDGSIKYHFQVKIRPLVVGVADLKKIRELLIFIQNKSHFGVYFQRNPGNFGRPISEHDYAVISNELSSAREAPVAPIDRPVPMEPRQKERPTEDGLSHFRIRDMLVEIGTMKGMAKSIKEYSFDHFKLDVAWHQQMVRAHPDYAFEVHFGGDLWKDLASLKHAYDRFNCNVFLVGRAGDKSQVDQILPGAFHEMRSKFRFVETGKIVRLHGLLKQVWELEESLGF